MIQIAGGMAEKGLNLKEIIKESRLVEENTGVFPRYFAFFVPI